MKPSSTVYSMNPAEYNTKLAKALKELPEFVQPEWSFYVKTGTAKVRPPQDPEFWHKRAASILRQIYIYRTVGVGRLKTRYGSRKNRGMQPEKFKKASGKMIRVILQQAEKSGILEKHIEPKKKAGRRLTSYGIKFLEGIK
jgi:small subunit ribosomal protein S19e